MERGEKGRNHWRCAVSHIHFWVEQSTNESGHEVWLVRRSTDSRAIRRYSAGVNADAEAARLNALKIALPVGGAL